LLRTLLEEVVMTVEREKFNAHLTLRWRGGLLSELDVPLPRSRPATVRTEEDTIELLRRLAKHYPDTVIRVLSELPEPPLSLINRGHAAPRLVLKIGVDPPAIKGSYAGAMGLPQFMPSNYRRYAVDFDDDEFIDLARSPADAIGSIASYLKAYGWTAGEVATAPVRLPADSAAKLVTGLQRVHNVAELQEKGVKFSASRRASG
jgi:hypothetical protein